MRRGSIGARALNLELQSALNSPGETQVAKFGSTLYPGDKMVQVVHDHDRDVFNGDLGVISGLSLAQGEIRANFDDREVT